MTTATKTERSQQQRYIRNSWSRESAERLQAEIDYRTNRDSNNEYDAFSIECLKQLLAECQA